MNHCLFLYIYLCHTEPSYMRRKCSVLKEEEPTQINLNSIILNLNLTYACIRGPNGMTGLKITFPNITRHPVR